MRIDISHPSSSSPALVDQSGSGVPRGQNLGEQLLVDDFEEGGGDFF